MSGFDRRVKADIFRWHTTKYANILPVGCLKVMYQGGQKVVLDKFLSHFTAPNLIP